MIAFIHMFPVDQNTNKTHVFPILLLLASLCCCYQAQMSQAWLYEHSICSLQLNSFNSGMIKNLSNVCVEADYMHYVNSGLKTANNKGNFIVLSILSSILSMYDDLRLSRRSPTILNLDSSHFHNVTKRALIYPISSCLPEENIVSHRKAKSIPFGHAVMRSSGDSNDTHIHLHNVSSSYSRVESSYFVIAQKKAVGWDSPKNLETLALGTLPLHLNIRHCPHSALAAHPKKLYQLLLGMPGLTLSPVSKKQVLASVHREHASLDVGKLDKQLYDTVVAALLQYTRNVLTTKAMAIYVVDTLISHSAYKITPATKLTASGAPELKVLYLSHAPHDQYAEEFMTDLVLHGLRRLLGEAAVTDHPRRKALYYDGLSRPASDGAHGWNLQTESRTVIQDTEAERKAVELAITQHKYDFVFFASDHHRSELSAADGSKTAQSSGLKDASKVEFQDLVCQHYAPSQVAYLDGSEHHLTTMVLLQYAPCVGITFSREGFNERERA